MLAIYTPRSWSTTGTALPLAHPCHWHTRAIGTTLPLAPPLHHPTSHCWHHLLATTCTSGTSGTTGTTFASLAPPCNTLAPPLHHLAPLAPPWHHLCTTLCHLCWHPHVELPFISRKRLTALHKIAALQAWQQPLDSYRVFGSYQPGKVT